MREKVSWEREESERTDDGGLVEDLVDEVVAQSAERLHAQTRVGQV